MGYPQPHRPNNHNNSHEQNRKTVTYVVGQKLSPMSPVAQVVYDDKYFRVVAPELPLNSREDGGHLILLKKLPVSDRSELTY